MKTARKMYKKNLESMKVTFFVKSSTIQKIQNHVKYEYTLILYDYYANNY